MQAESCSPEFCPETGNSRSGYVLCVEEDGFYYRTERVYGWVLVYCSNDDLGVKTDIDKFHVDKPDGATGCIWYICLEAEECVPYQ